MTKAISIALFLVVLLSIGCSLKQPARAKPRVIDFQNVLCTQQGDGLATCSCNSAEQIVDAKNPAHVLIRCR